tara:strand:+ start:407 stop:1528 length:1122 start_codon:yes stop_codon:yes gene_type:complete
MNDTSRKIVLALIALLVTFALIMALWLNRDIKNKGVFKKKYRSVRVTQVKLKSNSAEVCLSGKLVAKNRIDLFTEVGGVLMNDNFREGNFFEKGDVIAKLNSKEFEAALKAQKTKLITQVSSIMGDLKIDFSNEYLKWESFLNQVDVNSPLPDIPAVGSQKLKRFIAGKGVLNSYYSLKSQEEKLSKYSIRTPFQGVLTKAVVKKGTLVIPGQKIGTYINPGVYELETEISLSDLQFISIGSVFTIQSSELTESWRGTVSRINNSINASSQMVKIYITVSGVSLKEGMFLTADGKVTKFKNTLSINRKLVKNGGVYLVDSNKIKFKPVEVLHVNKSKAIIKGLNQDDKYVTDNMKGLYDGMEVDVVRVEDVNR